jgi:hypothetical protein
MRTSASLSEDPGTNGTRRFEGGWPTFSVDSYTNIGTNDNYMPYYRRDPQYQYVSNFNWNRGSHSVRFGADLYRQHLNQNQAEFVGGTTFGAQGGFTFGGGTTQVRAAPAPTSSIPTPASCSVCPLFTGRLFRGPTSTTCARGYIASTSVTAGT